MPEEIRAEVSANQDLLPDMPLVTAIQRATHILGLYLESALAPFDLSQGEIHVLSLLSRTGTASVSELQRGVRHRPSTLTGILDRLAAKKLVVRRINEADRRSNLIELTDEGRVAADRVGEIMNNIEQGLAEGCSAADMHMFREMLGQIGVALPSE